MKLWIVSLLIDKEGNDRAYRVHGVVTMAPTPIEAFAKARENLPRSYPLIGWNAREIEEGYYGAGITLAKDIDIDAWKVPVVKGNPG